MNNCRWKENWKQLVRKGGRECDNFTSFLSPSPIAFCARHQSLNGTITKSFKGHWVELQVLGVSPNSYDGLSHIYFFTGRRERFILTKFTKKKPFGLIICEPTISFYISHYAAPGPPEKLTCKITDNYNVHVKWDPPEDNLFLYPVLCYILQSSSGKTEGGKICNLPSLLEWILVEKETFRALVLC